MLNTLSFHSTGGPHAAAQMRRGDIFVMVIHRYSGSKWRRKSGQSIYITYIRGQRRNNSIISSGCLCFCGTIQPPQVSALMNSAWAGVKPLLHSPARIWKRCHLHRLPWQPGLWWVLFGWYPFYWGQLISDMSRLIHWCLLFQKLTKTGEVES